MEQNDKHLADAILLLVLMETPETQEAGSLSTHQCIVYLYEEPQGNMKSTA